MDKQALRWQLDRIQDDLAYLFAEMAFDRSGEAKSVLRDLLQALPAKERVLGPALVAQLQGILAAALAEMNGNRSHALAELANLRQGLRNALCRLDGEGGWYAWGTAVALPEGTGTSQ